MCPCYITAVSKHDDPHVFEVYKNNDEDYQPAGYERKNEHKSLNSSFFALWCSPVKIINPVKEGEQEAKKKLSQGHCALTEYMVKYVKVLK